MTGLAWNAVIDGKKKKPIEQPEENNSVPWDNMEQTDPAPEEQEQATSAGADQEDQKVIAQALLSEAEKLSLFFKGNAKGEYRVIDFNVFEYIKKNFPICIVGGVPFVYHDGYYERDNTSGTMIKGLIRDCLMVRKEQITSTIENRIYNLFLNDPELQFSMDQMNNYPKHWIVFRNCVYDPIEKLTFAHDPSYRAINRIAVDYKTDVFGARQIEEITEGKLNSKVYSWLKGLFPDPEDFEMVLEYCGYCLTIDTRQQKFLILEGLPASGKSVLIKLIGDIVGSDNISNLPLEKFSHRFASFNIMGKLVNSCGDIGTSVIDDITIQKQALGEDYIQAEAKGKDAISFKPYAKLLFSANGLPTIENEESSGFYRRVLVANTRHNVEKVDPMFYEKNILPEVDTFVYMIVKALERMYERGTIVESAGSTKSVNRMWAKSDPVKAFLDECTRPKQGAKIERSYLFKLFDLARFNLQAKKLSSTQFYASLRAKGYEVDFKTGGIMYVTDIELVRSSFIASQNIDPDNQYLTVK